MATSVVTGSGSDDSKSGIETDSTSVELFWPMGWFEAKGDVLKALKEAMSLVKGEFLKKAEELGFDGVEYHPTDTGKALFLLGGQHFIGKVSLTKPGLLGGYTASVRVSLTVGVLDPLTVWQLTGFIIDAKPFLYYVQFGEYIGVGGRTRNQKQMRNGNTFPQGWVDAGKDSLKLLKEAMTSVKENFLTRAKELGFDGNEYHPTDSGKALFLMGGQHFIGKVKLSKPGLLGGYFASVRVSRSVATAGPQQPFELTGFLIDSKPFLLYVEKYEFGWVGGSHWPRGWIDATPGTALKLLKEAMMNVKDDFFIKAKEYGFDPKTKEYYPDDTGIVMLLLGGQHFIGLVKLSRPEFVGGYYASIAVSRIVGTKDKQPYVLQGFIIDSRPFLRFVERGVFGRHISENELNSGDNGMVNAFTKLNVNSRHLVGTSSSVRVGFNGLGHISTAHDLTFVQSLVNQVKDEIKTKANITKDLSKFTVVSAAVQSFTIQTATFWVKIDIGESWGHSAYIYTVIQHMAFDGTSGVDVESAYSFPI